MSEPDLVPCPVCNGKGSKARARRDGRPRPRRPCPKCKGKGSIPTEVAAEHLLTEDDEPEGFTRDDLDRAVAALRSQRHSASTYHVHLHPEAARALDLEGASHAPSEGASKGHSKGHPMPHGKG